MAAPRQGYIPGYEVEVKRGLWERIPAFGVPRVIGSLWFVLCLLPAFLLLVLVSVKAVIVPGALWLLGQGAMMWLTSLDPYWDDVIVAQLVYRYKDHYEAG